eukprot:TRINITY_DN43881_c0_g1_i1.p1 TRINITY_DN43881_c0_g1~~TRINITY_DN43881_c0_g1_i1.p1  ORF type:complete len:410 (+),score=61.69 TRINITY_DN43881_c0_g1_i1:118-1347(+)
MTVAECSPRYSRHCFTAWFTAVSLLGLTLWWKRDYFFSELQTSSGGLRRPGFQNPGAERSENLEQPKHHHGSPGDTNIFAKPTALAVPAPKPEQTSRLASFVKWVPESGPPSGCAGHTKSKAVLCKNNTGRIVFSMTTTPSRIMHIKPALDSVLIRQSRTPDTVYLSVGPKITDLPTWLQGYENQYSGNGQLRVLRHASDLGPGLKLLGAAREELVLGHADSLIIYGDDDTEYGHDIVQIHLKRNKCMAGRPERAFGPRRIRAGQPEIQVLEATGSISVRAGAVPCVAFSIGKAADACKFSDDYYLARALGRAGLELSLLEECNMNWNTGSMSARCVRQKLVKVETIEPLSSLTLNALGKVKDRNSGDWRTQLDRYLVCERSLREKTSEEKLRRKGASVFHTRQAGVHV